MGWLWDNTIGTWISGDDTEHRGDDVVLGPGDYQNSDEYIYTSDFSIFGNNPEAPVKVTESKVTGVKITPGVLARIYSDPSMKKIYQAADIYDYDQKNPDGRRNRSKQASYVSGTTSPPVIILNVNADIAGAMDVLGYRGSYDDYVALILVHEMDHYIHQIEPTSVPGGYTRLQEEALARMETDQWAVRHGLFSIYGNYSSIDDYIKIVESENDKSRANGRNESYNLKIWGPEKPPGSLAGLGPNLTKIKKPE